MHHFEYQNDGLHCEHVPVAHIARSVGTPFYLYSQATLERHFSAFERAFTDLSPRFEGRILESKDRLFRCW